MNKLLPAIDNIKRRRGGGHDLSGEEVYIMCVPRGDGTGDGTE